MTHKSIKICLRILRNLPQRLTYHKTNKHKKSNGWLLSYEMLNGIR